MYAHKVLSSELINEDESFIKDITNSVKFHIHGTIVESRMATVRANNYTYNKDVQKFMKIPYPLMWIDTDKLDMCDSMCIGIVVKEIPYEEIHKELIKDRMPEDGPFVLLTGCASPDTDYWLPIPGSLLVSLNGDGKNNATVFYDPDRFSGGRQPSDSLLNRMSSIMYFILESMVLFLNCKNIRESIVYPPEKLNKKRLRNGKVPLFSYKTLHVVSGLKPSKGSQEALGNHNRIHLCRGHIKVFTEDKPLLGKHVGMYYWDSHVRGQNREGIVVKDYYCAD
jgi:hypothetical protein